MPTCCACHLQELNPLTSDNFESHNSVVEDLNSQPSTTNQRKQTPHMRIQQSTILPQFSVQETLPSKYLSAPVTRRPYKKSRNK